MQRIASRRSGGGSRRPQALFIAAAVLVAATIGVLAGTQPAGATPTKSRPVLFVHGYNPTSTSTDCGGEFDSMISQMRAEGFTGAMVKVGYYSGDANCNVNLHSYGSYDDRDSWKQIAKAFSTYVKNTYGATAVDVVGYSMGGLITRGAVYGAQTATAGFSTPINIGDVVTLGTPHQGGAWYTNACLWGQCSAMAPGATDLNWLNQNGNPQGSAGTTWTNLGSYNDDVVPWESATSMSIPTNHKSVFSNVSHTGTIHPNYMHSWATVNSAGNGLGTIPGAIKSGISSSKCIDVRSGSTANGTSIQIYDCNPAVPAQVFTHSASGRTLITAQGKCLDVTGESSSNGTKVQLYECNRGSNQEWTINTVDHTVRSLGKCLDDPRSDTTNGTQLQIYDCNGTAAQRWF